MLDTNNCGSYSRTRMVSIDKKEKNCAIVKNIGVDVLRLPKEHMLDCKSCGNDSRT